MKFPVPGLVKGLPIREFGKKSVLRNANFANLFHRMGYIEKMGTGISRMQNLVKKAGLEPIEFQFTTFVTAVFKRANPGRNTSGLGKTSVKKAGEKLGEKSGEKLGENENRILQLIEDDASVTYLELSSKIGISLSAVENNIKKLKNKGLLKRVGPPKGGHWEYLKNMRKMNI
ncbi:MAG: winged helix-turn-helix transcriptional regulator [Desulfobacterales bacterium]|nr:winged helix-turn-helix transcriptional regulator [Desulfobacterales bacterium]